MPLAASFVPARPVVLLHAFPLNRRMWQPQVKPLREAGFTPLALDLPGFGDSPLSGEVTLDDFARRVLETMDHFYIARAAVVGLSMGGYVTFRLLEMAPERLLGIVLADTRASADAAEARTRRYTQAAQVAQDGPRTIVDGFLQTALSPVTHARRPEVVGRVRQMVETAWPAGVIQALRAMAERPDSTGLLAHVTLPTLVVVGQQDALTPPETAREMADRIPGARIAVLAEAGHLANLEVPGPFSETLLAFLGQLPWNPRDT